MQHIAALPIDVSKIPTHVLSLPLVAFHNDAPGSKVIFVGSYLNDPLPLQEGCQPCEPCWELALVNTC